MRPKSFAQSAAAASIAETVILLLLYLMHRAIAGTFALPPNVLTVLVPLAPTIDAIGTWLVHGLATGQWTPIPTPTPAPAPVAPPTPITPPPTPPAV